ncbi:MAG: hypothetical protein JW871_04770 [Endomicrobiales bacterium]|nr:hypothetical protein [Endomicrobiales bacterium]
MAKLMNIQIEILKKCYLRDKNQLSQLLLHHNKILRWLALAVINGGIDLKTASKLLLKY